MPYSIQFFSIIPSFIAMILLTISDIKTRLVPRSVIIFTGTLQIVIFIIISYCFGTWSSCISAILASTVSGAVQLIFALIRPGTLGFGDVTATFLVALSVGWCCGFDGICFWWFLMGSFGLISIITKTRILKKKILHHDQPQVFSIPFVPVIALSAAITIISPLIIQNFFSSH